MERKMERNYKQKIRSSWLTDGRFQKWIVIKDDCVTCKYCCCKLQPKLCGLIAHSKRAKHLKAMAPFKAGSQQSLPFQPVKTTSDLKRAELRSAIYAACHTSILSIDHLSILQKNTFADSKIASDLRLGRTKCSSLIKNVLSPYFKKLLISDIANGSFSFIIDESTDIAIKKQLGVVIRYHSTKCKQIVNTFLKLVELEDSTAEGIVAAILKILEEYKFDIMNLTGLGTDNASTMVGTNKGVIALLKRKNPNITLVPCVCHSVQLAVSSASKNIPNELEYLISETYNWFSKSPLRQSNYHKLFQLINDGLEPLKIVRACDTRWLSIEIAVKRISDQWLELKTHFGIATLNKTCHKAKLLRELYTETNLTYLLFLKPVLHEVQKVNKSFESNTADPTKLFYDLKMLLVNLCYQIASPNGAFDPFTSPLENFLIPNPYFSYGFEEYIKSQVNEGTIQKETEKIIRKNCQVFLINLIQQLRQRLPSNIGTLQNIAFFAVENTLKVVKPKIFSVIEKEKSRFSTEEITMIEIQWKQIVNHNWNNLNSTTEFWAEVSGYKNAVNENPFQELSDLVFSFLVLPLSNTDVERIFSTMQFVKNKQRNRMQTGMLNSLLTIRYALKRTNKCCHDFEITDDVLKFAKNRDIYTNSDSSDEEEIFFEI